MHEIKVLQCDKRTAICASKRVNHFGSSNISKRWINNARITVWNPDKNAVNIKSEIAIN